MADEYTPTSWVNGVPPYIDAEHLNRIEAELVRLGTQLAAIKAAYLGKSAISNVQVNDTNKVPSSALVYGMNEDISVLNSNLQNYYYLGITGQVIPESSDLDDYTTPGTYRCQSSAIAKTLLNCPVSYAFKMIVDRGNDFLSQKIIVGNTASFSPYIRTYDSGAKAWNAWLSQLTDANLDIQTGVTQVQTVRGEPVEFSITFPRAFKKTPTVMCIIGSTNPNGQGVTVRSITTTVAKAVIYRTASAALMPVYWIAVAA